MESPQHSIICNLGLLCLFSVNRLLLSFKDSVQGATSALEELREKIACTKNKEFYSVLCMLDVCQLTNGVQGELKTL